MTEKINIPPVEDSQVEDAKVTTELASATDPLEEQPRNLIKPPLVDGKRQLGLSRIVGTDRPEFGAEGALKDRRPEVGYREAEKMFWNNDRFKDAPTMEKTPEQREICEKVIDLMPEFLKEFGLTEPVRVNPESIQIIDMEKLSEEGKETYRNSNAFWSTRRQHVIFNSDFIKNGDNLRFAKTLAHELIHMMSFNSVDIDYDNVKKSVLVRERRSGVELSSLTKGKEGSPEDIKYFKKLNEAVTESLARKFINRKISALPHVQKEWDAIESELKYEYTKAKKYPKYKDKKICTLDILTYKSYGDRNPDIVIKSDRGSYENEVQSMWAEVVKIAQETNDGKTKDDIFKVLTNAYFSGKLLDVARLFKKVYPEKSFRELGELASDKPTK